MNTNQTEQDVKTRKTWSTITNIKEQINTNCKTLAQKPLGTRAQNSDTMKVDHVFFYCSTAHVGHFVPVNRKT